MITPLAPALLRRLLATTAPRWILGAVPAQPAHGRAALLSSIVGAIELATRSTAAAPRAIPVIKEGLLAPPDCTSAANAAAKGTLRPLPGGLSWLVPNAAKARYYEGE